jgi:hypothetical protein
MTTKKIDLPEWLKDIRGAMQEAGFTHDANLRVTRWNSKRQTEKAVTAHSSPVVIVLIGGQRFIRTITTEELEQFNSPDSSTG